MSDAGVKPIDLAVVAPLVATTDTAVREAMDVARKRTDAGKGIDAAQVHCERLAYAATEVAAAQHLLAYAQNAAAAGHKDAVLNEMAGVFAAEIAHRLLSNIDAHLDDFGINTERLNSTIGGASTRALLRAALNDSRIQAIGRHVIQRRGVNHCWLDNEMAAMTRDSVRQFAEAEVAPIAERIHRH